MPSLTPCGEIARRNDPDRFLCALFAPPARRDHVFSLLAFEHEIAKTRSVVSEPMLGQIRLQWWREALDGIYGRRPRRHDVIEALAAAILAFQLPRPLLDGMIDAREDTLERSPADLEGLIRHADRTGGALADLWLRVVWPDPATPSAAILAATRDSGIAYALVGTLRAAAALGREGMSVLPADMLPESDRAAAQSGRDTPGIAAAAQRILAAADAKLAVTRDGARAIPRSARSAVLQATLARRYALRLARDEHRVFAARRSAASPMRPIWLLWAVATGRI